MLLTDQKVYPGFKALEYYRMWFNEGFCSQLKIGEVYTIKREKKRIIAPSDVEITSLQHSNFL